MRSKISLLTLTVFTSVFLLAGCSSASPSANLSEEELESRVKNGIEKLQAASSGSFIYDVSGTMTSEDPFAAEPTEQTVQFDVVADGKTMVTDEETGQFDMSLSLDGEGSQDDAEAQPLIADLVVKDRVLYLLLDEFPVLEGPQSESINQAFEMFSGKWWSFPLPEGVFTKSPASGFLEVPEEGDDLSEEQQQLKDLYDNTNFFESVEFTGTNSVMGVKSDRYEVTLDKGVLADYVVEAARIQGQEPTEDEIAAMRANLDAVSLDLSIWVAQKDGYISKVEGSYSGVSPEGALASTSANFDFVMEFGDYNKSVRISAPDDASEFDPSLLFGGFTPPQSQEIELPEGVELPEGTELPEGVEFELPEGV